MFSPPASATRAAPGLPAPRTAPGLAAPLSNGARSQPQRAPLTDQGRGSKESELLHAVPELRAALMRKPKGPEPQQPAPMAPGPILTTVSSSSATMVPQAAAALSPSQAVAAHSNSQVAA